MRFSLQGVGGSSLGWSLGWSCCNGRSASTLCEAGCSSLLNGGFCSVVGARVWGLRGRRWGHGWPYTSECNGHSFAVLGETASRGHRWGSWRWLGLILDWSGCVGCWSRILLHGVVPLPASGCLYSGMARWLSMRTPARVVLWWGRPFHGVSQGASTGSGRERPACYALCLQPGRCGCSMTCPRWW